MNDYLAQNVKTLRDREGLTQSELAMKIYKNRNHTKISKIEQGKLKTLDCDALIAFSNYFGYSCDDLLKKDLRFHGDSNITKLGKSESFNPRMNNFVLVEKSFRRIPCFNIKNFFVYLVLLLMFLISSFIKNKELKENFSVLIFLLVVGYSLYVLIKYFVSRREKIKKIYLTEDKELVYSNSENFYAKSYYITLSINLILSFIFVYKYYINALSTTEGMLIFIGFLIFFLLTFSLMLISLKSIYSKSNNLDYSLFYMEKTKNCCLLFIVFFSCIEKMFYFVSWTFYIFINLLYIFASVSSVIITHFFKGYTFEINDVLK